MLKEGDTAPNFKLKDAHGNEHSLTDFRGRKVVLYFYPKDDTPGCTIEACSFRDDYDKYTKQGVAIIGISADEADSHSKFLEKHNLPFLLLSDLEHETIKQYYAWGEQNWFGKIRLGILRMTFIIDEQGKIMKVFPKVSVDTHSKEILEFLEAK
ncbi:MAG: thioredoxin-dependent thiol peroxidase [Candidatus Woesearchaeota archaeon]